MYIIYEKAEKKIEIGSNIVVIDLEIDNLVACTNMNNSNSLIIAGGRIKFKNRIYK